VYKAVPRDEYCGREDVCTGPLGVIGLGGDAERGSCPGQSYIVMAMTTAAITQPSAIHKPPKTIQSRLRRMEMMGHVGPQMGMQGGERASILWATETWNHVSIR
jgi:hypothetical protein